MKQFDSYKEFLAAVLNADPEAQDAVEGCNAYCGKEGHECCKCPVAPFIRCPAMYD